MLSHLRIERRSNRRSIIKEGKTIAADAKSIIQKIHPLNAFPKKATENSIIIRKGSFAPGVYSVVVKKRTFYGNPKKEGEEARTT